MAADPEDVVIRDNVLIFILDDYIKKNNGYFEIPDSVTAIRSGVFAYRFSLKQVTIPGSVTTIGEHVFWACKGLKQVTILDSVAIIGNYVFHGCPDDLEITITTFDLSKEKEKATALKQKLQAEYPNIKIRIDNPLERLKGIPTFFSKSDKQEAAESSPDNQNQPGA